MNESVERIFYAAAAVGLAVAAWVFGFNLMPARAAAQEQGIYIPWIITWAMIIITTISALGLAGYLVFAKKDRF